jgi:hypothetical protein
MAPTEKPIRRDIDHVRYSTIGPTDNPYATVLTYGTRPRASKGPFHYKTVVLGRWHADRSIFKTWIMDWPDEQTARAGHPRLCDDLHARGPAAIPPAAILQ